MPPASVSSPRRVVRRAFDWYLRDRRTGNIVVAQFPNLALWTYLASVVAGRLITDPPWHTLVRWAAAASLGWWAGDELIRGVNPWRRTLGLAGLCAAALSIRSLLG